MIGFMGCGKSSTARELGKKIGYNVLDLDLYIEESLRSSVSDIFAQHGEEGFREIEAEALRAATQGIENTIVSVGGGTPCYKDNMEYMNSTGTTLYLKQSVPRLVARLSKSRKPRPLIAGMGIEELEIFIKAKLAQREPYYNLASIVADNPSRNATTLEQIIRLSPDF